MHSLGEEVPSPVHGVLLACSPLYMLGPPQLTTDPSLSCNHSTSTGLALISPEILFSNHGPAFPNIALIFKTGRPSDCGPLPLIMGPHLLTPNLGPCL